MKNCVFCKIIAGELPSACIYEDETVFAFLDIAPINKGHTLVIPKVHHTSLTTLPDTDSAHLMKVAKTLAKALMRVVDADGFNLILSNGTCAGQVVPHVHLHVVPRHPDDGITLPSQSAQYADDKEKERLARDVIARMEQGS